MEGKPVIKRPPAISRPPAITKPTVLGATITPAIVTPSIRSILPKVVKVDGDVAKSELANTVVAPVASAPSQRMVIQQQLLPTPLLVPNLDQVAVKPVVHEINSIGPSPTNNAHTPIPSHQAGFGSSGRGFAVSSPVLATPRAVSPVQTITPTAYNSGVKAGNYKSSMGQLSTPVAAPVVVAIAATDIGPVAAPVSTVESVTLPLPASIVKATASTFVAPAVVSPVVNVAAPVSIPAPIPVILSVSNSSNVAASISVPTGITVTSGAAITATITASAVAAPVSKAAPLTVPTGSAVDSSGSSIQPSTGASTSVAPVSSRASTLNSYFPPPRQSVSTVASSAGANGTAAVAISSRALNNSLPPAPPAIQVPVPLSNHVPAYIPPSRVATAPVTNITTTGGGVHVGGFVSNTPPPLQVQVGTGLHGGHRATTTLASDNTPNIIPSQNRVDNSVGSHGSNTSTSKTTGIGFTDVNIANRVGNNTTPVPPVVNSRPPVAMPLSINASMPMMPPPVASNHGLPSAPGVFTNAHPNVHAPPINPSSMSSQRFTNHPNAPPLATLVPSQQHHIPPQVLPSTPTGAGAGGFEMNLKSTGAGTGGFEMNFKSTSAGVGGSVNAMNVARVFTPDIPRPSRKASAGSILYSTYSVSGRRVPPSTVLSTFQALDSGNSSPRYIRSTYCAPPCTAKLLNELVLPYCVVVQPFAPIMVGEMEIPVVDLSVITDVSPTPSASTSHKQSVEHKSSMFGQIFGSGKQVNTHVGNTATSASSIPGQDAPTYKALPPRCSRCGCYMNCFVKFIDAGQNWSCNLCQMTNIVPPWYTCSLDGNGNRLDRMFRAELHKGSLEYIVSPENYTSQFNAQLASEPSFIFVVDISSHAIESGWTKASVDSIQLNLRSIPDNARVAVCTFHNGGIQLYRKKIQRVNSPLKRGASSSLNTSDDSFPFSIYDCEVVHPFPGVPTDDWLLPFADHFELFNALLVKLQCESFLRLLHRPDYTADAVLKPAVMTPKGSVVKDNTSFPVSVAAVLQLIQQAMKLASRTGCKVYAFTCGGTNHIRESFGYVPPREELIMYGKPEEILTYAGAKTVAASTPVIDVKNAVAVYEQLRIDLIAAGISVDIFVHTIPSQYQGDFQDLPLFAELCAGTGGLIHHMEGDVAVIYNSERLTSQLQQAIMKRAATDVTMRLRCSLGYAPASYNGCGSMGEHDVVTMPAMSTDNCVNFTMRNNESLKDEDPVYIQVAVLYTAYVPAPVGLPSANTPSHALGSLPLVYPGVNGNVAASGSGGSLGVGSLADDNLPSVSLVGRVVPQRRVRILNLCCFSSNNPQLIYRHVDMDALVTGMFKQAVDLTYKRPPWHDSKINNSSMLGTALRLSHTIDPATSTVGAIEYITGILIRAMSQYRVLCLPPEQASNMNKILLPDTLKFFPLFCLGMLKHPALISNQMTKQVRINVRGHIRSYYLSQAQQAGVSDVMQWLYPRVFALHQLNAEDGELISLRSLRAGGNSRNASGKHSKGFSNGNSGLSPVSSSQDFGQFSGHVRNNSDGVAGGGGGMIRVGSMNSLGPRTVSITSMDLLNSQQPLPHNGIGFNTIASGVLNNHPLHRRGNLSSESTDSLTTLCTVPADVDDMGGDLLTKLPDRVLPPSSEHFESDGLYLMDDGHVLWIYIGRNVAQAKLEQWFSNMKSPYYSDKKQRYLLFNSRDDEACRMSNIVRELSSGRATKPEVRFIFADDTPNASSSRFQLRLVEDSIYGELSYAEYLLNIQAMMKKYKEGS